MGSRTVLVKGLDPRFTSPWLHLVCLPLNLPNENGCSLHWFLHQVANAIKNTTVVPRSIYWHSSKSIYSNSIPVLSAPSLEPRQVRRTSAMQHERGVLLYSISNLQITVAWFSQNRSAQEKDLVSEVESQPSGWRLQVPPACQIKTWEHCSIKMKSQKKIRNS